MKFLSVLAGLVWAVLLAPVAAAQNLIPIEAFAQPPQLRHADLSPDGQNIAFAFQQNGQEMIGIAPARFGEGAQIRVRPVGGADLIVDVEWLNSGRVMWVTSRPQYLASLENQVLYQTTRLHTADVELEDVREVVPMPRQRDVRTTRPQFLGNITHLLPDDPEHIVQTLNWREMETMGLYRTNVERDTIELIEQGRRGTRGYLVTASGEARVAWGFDGERGNGAPFLVFKRPGDSRWTEIPGVLDGPGDFHPLGVSEDPAVIYVASNHDADTLGVFEFILDTRSFGPLIYRHPDYDIDGLVYDAGTNRLTGVRYTADAEEIHYLDGEIAAAETRLSAAMNDELAEVVDSAPDGSVHLVAVSDADDPGRLYLFDPAAGGLNEIGPFWPMLDGQPMGSVHSVTVTARDGLALPGYVTLPPAVGGLAAARELPFVILIHGGPAARDARQFDDWAQFLASRGYGVLQVNFRGSAGLGRALMEAGDGEWGGGMQDDIEDAADWLVAEGLAREGQIALMGASFGGYAALMTAARNDGRYAAAISINGVTDLHAQARHWNQFIGGRQTFNEQMDGVSRGRMSPVNRADDITIPVLLAHSTYDTVVPFFQFEIMQAALERANAPATFLELELDGHSVNFFQNRYQLLANIQVLLFQHMPSPELLAAAEAAGRR